MLANDSALRALLTGHQVTDAYAPYWMAYRVTFETGGRTLVTPYDLDRYPPIAAAVEASPHPAYLFVTTSRTVRSFEARCTGHGVEYQAWRQGAFTVVQPTAKVSPAMLPHDVVVVRAWNVPAHNGLSLMRRCLGVVAPVADIGARAIGSQRGEPGDGRVCGGVRIGRPDRSATDPLVGAGQGGEHRFPLLRRDLVRESEVLKAVHCFVAN